MADTTRPSGKRGRRQARHVHELMLTRFRAPGQAAPPETGDVSAGIESWGMLGNDEHSDCVPAACEHGRMAKAGRPALEIGGTTVGADDAEATVYTMNLYRAHLAAQGETGDPGVVIADYLQWGYELGLWEGFGQIDPRDVAQVHQDMLDFGGVLLGVELADDAEQRFETHVPWDVTAAEQPDPNAGHGVWLVGYDSGGETVVTWAAKQRATIAWEAGAVEEAWVILTKEDAERAGVDLTALRAEIDRLAGQSTPPSPGAPPAPAPQPVPVPVVDPGTNSPRGDAAGHTVSTLTQRVEAVFAKAHADAHAVLDRARLEAHAVLVDALGPRQPDDEVIGS